jgi:hypothetical protein
VNPVEKDPLQKRLEITNWVLLAILVAGSLLLRSSRFSLGVLYGGLISIVNFHWLYRNLLNAFTKHPSQARKAILFRYTLRLAVTGLVLYWIISGNLADVIGLVIGLSVVVLNIILTTVLALSKKCPIGEVK